MSKHYAIMRLNRVKTPADMKGLEKHIDRLQKKYENENINPELSHLNYDLIPKTNKSFLERANERIEEGYNGKRKIRTDAIKIVDGMITSGKEFFEDLSEEEIRKFFDDTFEFVKNTYGAENILYAVVHMDEIEKGAPHLHFGFTPLTKDGRLSAKEILGNRKSMIELQDNFHEFMTKEKGWELERGKSAKETQRKHFTPAEFKNKTRREKLEKEIETLSEKLNLLETTFEERGIEFEQLEKEEQEILSAIRKQVSEAEMELLELEKEKYSVKKEKENLSEDVERLKQMTKQEVVQENLYVREEYSQLVDDYNYLLEDYNENLEEKEKLQEENEELDNALNFVKNIAYDVYERVEKIKQNKLTKWLLKQMTDVADKVDEVWNDRFGNVNYDDDYEL